MTKQQFIDQKIKELKEMIYKGEDLMTKKEEIIFRKFFEKFLDDLKEVAKNNKIQK